MKNHIHNIDEMIIGMIQRVTVPMARLVLFTVFFWFGILKILDTSPANPLVRDLLERTLPFVSFENFIVFFSIYEMVIGMSFLVPGLERLAIALLIPHMITTFLPLIFLPQVTWQGAFTPTLEGQYIIKNLVIISLALALAARVVRPFRETAGNIERIQ